MDSCDATREQEMVRVLSEVGFTVKYHPPTNGARVRISQVNFRDTFGYGGWTLQQALKKLLERKNHLLTAELKQTIEQFMMSSQSWYKCPGCDEWENYDDPVYDMFFPEDSEVPFHRKCYDG